MPNKRFNKQVPAFKAGGRAGKMGGGMMMKKPMMKSCLLYTSPSPRDRTRSRMPSSA